MAHTYTSRFAVVVVVSGRVEETRKEMVGGEAMDGEGGR